jgi:hypothetical protein
MEATADTQKPLHVLLIEDDPSGERRIDLLHGLAEQLVRLVLFLRKPAPKGDDCAFDDLLLCVEFPQTDVRMIPASTVLHSAIVERRITLPDDPELARHAADTIARHGRRGWRIDKPRKEINIDAIVALAMAVDRAENKPAPIELVGWL